MTGKANHERVHQVLARDQFESILSNIQCVTYRCSLDRHWTMTYMSPQMGPLSGYPPEEFIGNAVRTFESIIHREDTGYVSRCVNEAVDSGAAWEIEYRIWHRDGTPRWVYEKGRALPGPDGEAEYLDGFIINITERKRAEEALNAAHQRILDIVAFLPDATFVVDKDRRVIAWNRAMEQMTGVPKDEMLGRGDHAYGVPFYGEAKPMLIDRIRQGDEQLDTDYIDVHREHGRVTAEVYLPSLCGGKGGHVLASAAHLLDSRGNITGGIETIRDISDRKKTQGELERLMSAIEQAAEVIVITDVDGNIEYVNPAFERVTGYDRQESVGENPRILKSGKQDAAFYEALWDTLLSGKTWTGRMVNRRKDGRLFTEEAVISPVRDGSGQTVNYVAVKHDITERLHLEQEKARIEQQYNKTQKLESIGRLAGGVAHDLNNLLSPILGYSEMLLEDAVSVDPRREPLTQIMDAALRARDLVRQLLVFGRKQALEFREVDLNLLLRNFEKLLRRTIREDIALEMILENPLPFIQGDVGQLEQIVMNLVVNAQDAMPDGGELTLETALAPASGSQNAPPPGSHVLLTVRDTGCGMDPSVREHLFEPFFTTKSKDQGTGLGLATVYGIVKQHGGNIEVHSDPDKGTTFKIYLPALADSAGLQDDDERPAGASAGWETILLVEDNAQVRNLVATVLSRRGYTILRAKEGQEALALLADHDGPVHLLLTDIVMPGMGGRQLYEKVAERYTEMKVLYMSGYTDDVIAHHGVIDPDTDYIQKPFSNTALAIKIREVLNG